jgi:hypothetical protein
MLDHLYRKPMVGSLGLAVGSLTQPLGHTRYKFKLALFDDYAVYSSVVMGVVGLGLIARRPKPAASATPP